MEKDYSNTLNLPKTEFPMRGGLPKKEPEILEDLKNKEIYKKLLEKNKQKPAYILHDGPPFANGDIHLGHALNKVLKDIVVKYKAMTGFHTPYIPGWDTHGLPIETQVIKKFGMDRFKIGPVKFRKACKDFAKAYIDKHIEQFKRLGVVGDFDNPYITYEPEYEAKQIEVFGEIAKKDIIYKGLKPVYWCADCITALAEAEIEYEEDRAYSIYVKFKVSDDLGILKEKGIDVDNTYFVIWTTTTWTLPGNVAICLNKDFDYAAVKTKEGNLIIAKDLVDSVMNAVKIDEYEIIAEFKGKELDRIKCFHPFLDRTSLLILGDHVTLEAGTGCVHTAPGFGMDDFLICQKYEELPIVVSVDAKGIMTEEAGQFEGLSYSDANKKIAEKLEEDNLLLGVVKITHQYPHCWRCKSPIIYRATEQWFASVDAFKEAALKAVKEVSWIPKWGEDRIAGMIKDRNDWCISRQRMWGVPIPIFYCEDCKKYIINDTTIKAIKELFKKEGSDAWYEIDATKFLGDLNYTCSCGSKKFTKETDIMDVWFDSGSSHAAVLDVRDEVSFPADLYLEGNDQYRGWFQSSLLTAVATKGTAPYRSVLTHGFVVDGEGKKMSKSTGNNIKPQKIIDQYGADILRLWVTSTDYKGDVRISDSILKQLTEIYRKIRNTARYMLGNLNDFDPNTDLVDYKDMAEIDRWAVLVSNQMTDKVNKAYENFEYHILYHTIHNFCVLSMSNFYLDIIKDRLYTERANSYERKSAQSAMYIILNHLVKLLAPVLAFTTEEIWQYMPHFDYEDKTSVLLNDMPKYDKDIEDTELLEKWSRIIDIREETAKSLEIARENKIIGHSLIASLTLYAKGELLEFLKSIKPMLETIFIVSEVKIGSFDNAPENAYKAEDISDLFIEVSVAPGEKCERCWMYKTSVGEDENHPDVCKRCADVLR